MKKPTTTIEASRRKLKQLQALNRRAASRPVPKSPYRMIAEAIIRAMAPPDRNEPKI